ncbi:MAG: Spy/CpxP family protein refolding chaperone [Pyrinomonadaceae bacterium]
MRKYASNIEDYLLPMALLIAGFLLTTEPALAQQQAQQQTQQRPSTDADSVTTSPAQDGEKSTAGRPGGGWIPWTGELNLTPEQIEKLKAINRSNWQSGEQRAALQRLQQARRAMDEVITSDHPDEESINARARELGEAQTALARIRAKNELMVRDLLTPEQLDKFREIRRRQISAQQEMRQNQRLRRNPDGQSREPGSALPDSTLKAPQAPQRKIFKNPERQLLRDVKPKFNRE